MKRFTSGLAIAALVVLGLSACAPATTAHSSAPTRGAPATPTPTQAAVPVVRVGVKCASVLSDSAAAGLIGEPVKFHLDENSQPVYIGDVVSRQYGTLTCLWGGSGRTDGGYDSNVRIAVAPDTAAAFNSNLPSILSESAGAVKNTAGDQSEYLCNVEGELQCTSNMLVGSFWVSAYVQTLGGTVTQVEANARIQLVLASVATALMSAATLPEWVPPGSSVPGFCASPGTLAQVKSALGVSDFAVTGTDIGPADADSYAQLAEGYTQCTWSSAASKGKFTSLAVAILKGGAWVVPQLVGKSNDLAYMLGAYSSMTIPGADSAVGSCSVAAQECDITLAIGSTLVNIQTDDPSPALVNAALAKLVADIKAS